MNPTSRNGLACSFDEVLQKAYEAEKRGGSRHEAVSLLSQRCVVVMKRQLSDIQMRYCAAIDSLKYLGRNLLLLQNG